MVHGSMRSVKFLPYSRVSIMPAMRARTKPQVNPKTSQVSFRADARNLEEEWICALSRHRAFARSFIVSVLVCAIGFSFFAANAVAGPAPVRFNRDALPIFVKNCFSCHGADAAKRKAEFRLDDDSTLYKALPSGNVAIVPGDR